MPETSTDRTSFGPAPPDERTTGHYLQEYVEAFVEKWDECIDWDRRAAAESDLFIRVLHEHGARCVLDVATGTGFHSIRLVEAGFDVTSADGSLHMLARAFENAKAHDYILRTIQADWRWLTRDVFSTYDAVICLGNSFPHLFTQHDRRRALAEFHAALEHDGVLVLDHRNYDAVLDRSAGAVQWYDYGGRNVEVQPVRIDDELVRIQYRLPDGSTYTLNTCPIRRDETRRLLAEAGFQTITTHENMSEGRDAPDFFIHVAEKQYRPNVAPPPESAGERITQS